MLDLDISFGESPWERFFERKKPEERISALELLTMMESEETDLLEDALSDMEEAQIALDISALPKLGAAGESAVRLQEEMQLLKDGFQLEALPEEDPLRVYLEEIAAVPCAGDESVLAQTAADGNEGARNRLAELGLSRVVALAKDYVGYGVLLLDLIQEANLGLWKAICGYKTGDYGVYRDWFIHFYLSRLVLMQAQSSGIGEKLKTAMEDYRAIDQQLLAELGRNPTLEELADKLHLSPEEAGLVKKTLEDAQILANLRKEPEDTPVEAEQAVEDTAAFQMRQRILDLLSQLNEVDRELLTLRFGLEGGLPLTPEETGKKLGFTASEVLQREAAALSLLRNQK